MTPSEVQWVKGLEQAVREMDARLRAFELERIKQEAYAKERKLIRKKLKGGKQKRLWKKYLLPVKK